MVISPTFYYFYFDALLARRLYLLLALSLLVAHEASCGVWKCNFGVSEDLLPCPLPNGVACASHFDRCSFNFWFCIKSLNLFDFTSYIIFNCPSIEINYILYFHFGLYSFNFDFGFKSLNMCDIDIRIIVNWILQLKSIIYFIFISALILLIIVFKFNHFISIYIDMH